MPCIDPGALRVSADGATVVVRDDHDLHALDPADGTTRWRATIDGLRDHVVIGDEVWAVAPARATCLDLATGAERARHEVPAGAGPICAAPWLPGTLARAGAAAWLIARGEHATSVTPLPACDLALPAGGGRLLTVTGGTAELRRPGGPIWTTSFAGERALGGALILEGRAAAICLGRAGAPTIRIVVVNLRDGATLHAIGVDATSRIAFAARRGWALVRSDPHQLTVVDLRFGRVVGARDEAEAIDEIAVDAGFERVVMRIGDPPRLAVAAAGALLAATTPSPALAVAPPPPVSLSNETPPPPAPPPPPVRPPPPAGPLLGLADLDPVPAASPEESAVDLQTRLYWIGALVDHAIAEGWDSGRIAAPSTSALPFEHEVTGTLHHVRGRATAQLERARRHVEHYRQVRAEVDARRAGRATPLERLASEVGLSRLAADLLIAAAAPLLWGELARLYGILTNDPARPLCDELLLCQLLAPETSRGQIARELDPDRPLRRFGLLQVDGRHPRPFGAIRVEPVVIALLRGIDPEASADGIRLRAATTSLERIRVDAARRDGLITALAARADTPARIALRGRPGAGRRTLAAALAARCDRPLAVVDAGDGSRDPEDRAEHLRLALLRCRMLGWIPCVEGLDDVAVADHPAAAAVRAVLDLHPGPVFLRLPSEANVPLAPGHRRVDLGALDEGARADAWAEALRDHDLPDDDAAELGSRFRVGPGVVARAVAGAAAALGADDGAPTAETTTRAVDAAVRQHLEDRLGAIASRVTRLAGWADLVLPEDVLDSLLELVSRVRRRRIVFETWGYDRRITSARGVTALFQGGPGTGKSLAAGVIARELGLDLYRVDVARVVSKWVGETEKNLAAVFDAAEDGQAVLLFDEADSLFARRTEVKSSVDRYANLEVNYLLQRLDSFEGIAILTTNLGTSIDPAFKRRLGMRLTFPFPDEEMRERMWENHVPPEVPRAGELDFDDLARRFRLSGGYIRNAALRAAFLAAEEGVGLAQQHLERAIRLEFREIGKLSETGTLE